MKTQDLLQDGLLAHYLQQAGMSDVNVEKRLDKEPFDAIGFIKKDKYAARAFSAGTACANKQKLVNP